MNGQIFLRWYNALVALLFFFLPCIGSITFFLLVHGFVPSTKLARIDVYYSLVSAVVISSVLVPKFIEQLLKSKTLKERLKHVAMVPFTPIFGAAIAHFFLVGPIAYGLHQYSSPRRSVAVETVQSASSGGKHCRNKLVLSESNWHFERFLCGIQATDIETLRNGGTVELYGNSSAYGFLVQHYQRVGG
jgi:hypothetical protein